jgi:hypothetical protein
MNTTWTHASIFKHKNNDPACTEINAFSEHTANIETILQRIILNQPFAICVRCFSIGEIGVTSLQVLLLPQEHALVSTQSILRNANMSGNHFASGNDNLPSPFTYFLYIMAV